MADNIIEIPAQQPQTPSGASANTATTGATTNNAPPAVGETPQAVAQTATTTPAKSGGMWVLYFVLGLAFFIALIYLISRFMKGSTKGASTGDSTQQRKGLFGGGQKEARTQQPEVRTQTVYVNAGATPASNPHAVATKGTFSAELKRAQQNLIDTCGAKMPVYGADGFLGDETINAVAKIGAKGAEIAQQMKATGYVTREQMDWLLKPCGGSNSPSSSKTSSNKPVKDYSVLYCSQIQELIRNHPNRDKSKDRIGGVSGRAIPNFDFWCGITGSNASLVEWIQALDENKKTFFCRNCSTKGEYSTATGNAT